MHVKPSAPPARGGHRPKMSPIRRLLLALALLASTYVAVDATIFTLSHFVIGKEALGWSAGGRSPPGESIVNPLIYSLHIGALWFGALGSAWLVVAAYRQEIHWRSWLACGACGIALGATPILWEDRGYGVDYQGLGRLIGFGIWALWALALTLSGVWLRGQAAASPARPSPFPRASDSATLPRRERWMVAILAGGLVVLWLIVGAPIDEMQGWDPDRSDAGFNDPLKHLSGASLPLLVAAAPLAGLLALPMGAHARRLLGWELTLLQAGAYAVHMMSWLQALAGGGWVQAMWVLALDSYWAVAWWVAVRPTLGFAGAGRIRVIDGREVAWQSGKGR